MTLTTQEQVMVAIQQWRDATETQALQEAKPASYDAVVRSIATALEYARAHDPAVWDDWARTARREGARAMVIELAMIGRAEGGTA